VVEASDGKNALHYLTANLPEPALIVTDLAMPDMTGWEFINILQAYVKLSSIPVLVVSAVDFRRAPAHEEAVVEIFKKPVDAPRFLAAVHRHCVSAGQREARRADAAKKVDSPPF
jgi:CheY-like chemotaxis protein